MSDNSNNVSSFLKKINSIKGEDVKLHLLSQAAAISVPSLNLKQQKDIISCVADGVAGLISFTRILNSVVLDATDDNTLKVYDRAPVAVALRVNALGHEYKDADNKPANLLNVLNNIQKAYKKRTNDTCTVEYANVRVDLAVPTLYEENAIIKRLEEEIKRNGDNNTKNLGSIYVYEIIKYIKAITIDDTTLEYSDIKIGDKITLIEALPLFLNRKIIEYIESFRKEEKELLTDGDVTVEINPGFFDAD